MIQILRTRVRQIKDSLLQLLCFPACWSIYIKINNKTTPLLSFSGNQIRCSCFRGHMDASGCFLWREDVCEPLSAETKRNRPNMRVFLIKNEQRKCVWFPPLCLSLIPTAWRDDAVWQRLLLATQRGEKFLLKGMSSNRKSFLRWIGGVSCTASNLFFFPLKGSQGKLDSGENTLTGSVVCLNFSSSSAPKSSAKIICASLEGVHAGDYNPYLW